MTNKTGPDGHTVSLEELLELSISSKDLGTVNFNLLRLLLSNLVNKISKVDKEPVKLGDQDANQVSNYKNYIQGAKILPMPGVMRYPISAPEAVQVGTNPMTPRMLGLPPIPGPGQAVAPTNQVGTNPLTPRTPKPGLPPTPGPAQLKRDYIDNNTAIAAAEVRASILGPVSHGSPRDSIRSLPMNHGMLKDLQDRIISLEQQLQIGNHLPENRTLLDRKNDKDGGMTVNDMWQLIQLNNRIAAAEAAIQKMASLIEDIAKGLNKLRGDTSGVQSDAQHLARTNSQLAMQVSPLGDLCAEAERKIEDLKHEMDLMKYQLDLVQKATGIDLSKMPSFLKPKPGSKPSSHGSDPDGHGHDHGQDHHFSSAPSNAMSRISPEQLARLSPDQIAKLTPDQFSKLNSDQLASLSPEQLTKISPEHFAKLSPEMLSNFTPEQFAIITPEQMKKLSMKQVAQLSPEQMSQFSPEQLKEIASKRISLMSLDKLADISNDQLESLTLTQINNITPEQLSNMTESQREHIDNLKTQKKPTPNDINTMTSQEISKLTPDQINKMTASEIEKIDPDKLAHMSPDQIKRFENAKNKGIRKDKKNRILAHLDKISSEELRKLSLSDLEHLSASDIAAISPEQLSTMTPAQKATINKIKKRKGPQLNKMTPKEIAEIPESELEKLTATQLADITSAELSQMTPQQRKKIESLKQKKKMSNVGPDFDHMRPDEIRNISLTNIANMTPTEAALLPTSVIEKMTQEQREFIKERTRSGKPGLGIANMNPEEIAFIPVEDLGKLTPNELSKIPQTVLDMMTDEQRAKIEHLKKEMGILTVNNLNNMSPEQIANIPLSGLSRLTPSQIKNISEEVKNRMTPEQLSLLEEILIAGKLYDDTDNGDDFPDDKMSGAGTKKKKKTPKRHRHKNQPTDAGHEDQLEQDQLEVHKNRLGEHMEILTMEGYLASLPKEDLENMAADAVQQELQRQYAHLQTLQSQLSKDIQDKMEIIYQKLLKEIITQQLTSSPYTVVDGPEKCLGPGICKGHGMPAGIAVCQYPDSSENTKIEKPPPGEATCPECDNKELKNLKPPGKGKTDNTEAQSPTSGRIFEHKEVTDHDHTMRDMIHLDLEKIRHDIRNKEMGSFDEKDILERLGTLWEAVKVLKSNEESLASRISKQESIIKKLPTRKTMALGDYNENVNLAQLKDQLGYLSPVATTVHPTQVKREGDQEQKGDGEVGDKEDIQTLFNNLANVIAECADQKDRIDQLVDAVRIIESGMVTRQMLTDTLSDKADRGQINTKVSYDEFGNTVDELHNQLHNLMVEGYTRNENWKKVTADLAEELAEKLDKVELAPIRAFFKSRLKKLEDRVMTLSTLLEEPDPAGTRKKLFRDYNCISCDRKVNISGITNSPTLPMIPPCMVSSSSAPHRAYDLHQLRNQRTRQDPESREMATLEKQMKAQVQRGVSGRSEQLNGKDMMQLVNKYVGQNGPATQNVTLPNFRKSSGSQNTLPQIILQPTRVSDSQIQLQLSKQPELDLLEAEENIEIDMEEEE